MYTQEVQAHIILNVLLGEGKSSTELKYFAEGMKEEKLQLSHYIDKIILDVWDRIAKNPLILVCPSLFLKQITEVDKRYFANCGTLRAFIMESIKERAKNPNIDEEGDLDLMSMLV